MAFSSRDLHALTDPPVPAVQTPNGGTRTAPWRQVTIDVHARLWDQIREGRYLPASTLPSERDLAAQFGVSRESIRAALGMLEAQ